MAHEVIPVDSSSESDFEDSSDCNRENVQKDCVRRLLRLSPSSERQGPLAGSSTTSSVFRRSPDVMSPRTINDSVDDSTDYLGRSESEEPVTCGSDRDEQGSRSPPADAMLFRPKGESAPATCDGSSAAAANGDCSDESDDGDFYTRSVSDMFAKRQLSAAARVMVPQPAKKSRLVVSKDSLSSPESPGHVSSLDESDEEKPTQDPSVVRTPSPPPQLDTSRSGSKRRRPRPVINALSALQRYMRDNSKEAATEICEITSPVETKMRRRTVFLLVKLHSLTEKFRIGTDERLASVISKLADKEGVSPMRILLYFNDVQVAPDDTPASLGLKAGDTLDCVTVPFEGDPQLKSISCASEDRVQLKVQDCCGQRSRIVMSVGKREPLKSLMVEFAQRKGVSVDSLVFHFDGEELPATATCEDVGLEDDFCIDVTAK